MLIDSHRTADGADKDALPDNAAFCRYARFYDGEELAQAEVFLQDENKKLSEYDEEIKRYHDMCGQIATDVERTVFVGFFEISHASFLDAIIENLEHLKGLFLRHLVDKYQTTAKG